MRKKTIFNQLEDNKITWKVYFPGFISITLLLHFAALRHYQKHFQSIDHFYQDAASGNLPDYAFVEPEFLGSPSDYHPTDASNSNINHSSILAGEIFLKQVYDAVRLSPQRDETLFVVTFDEGGGTYDHVVPPTNVTPPDGSGKGEMDFTFDRLGFRVPMIWMSSYLMPGTTINTQFQHTSWMRFVRSLFNLPDTPLTNRDRDAPNVPMSIFGSVKRDWPNVTARNDTNPGSSGHPSIDEMSYFVSLAHAVFQEYLDELKCSVDQWLGDECTSGSGSQGLSNAAKGGIAAAAAGGVLIIVAYCCCCRNNGALWAQWKINLGCAPAPKKKNSQAVTNPGSPTGEVPL